MEIIRRVKFENYFILEKKATKFLKDKKFDSQTICNGDKMNVYIEGRKFT